MTERFDMVVIGSGPAGEKGAAKAAYFGKRVAMVERSPHVGGSAVGNAGIPTKTLRETALYITGFSKRDVYGLHLQLDAQATIEHLRARTGEVIATMTAAVEKNLERHGIEVVRGQGTLEGHGVVRVTSPDREDRMLEGEVILIATGSRPAHPPGVPFDDPDVYDSEDVLSIDKPVRNMVVVGSSAVGCEYASIFNALGADVTLVNRSPRLLKFLDREVSACLVETFSRAGMRVILGAGRVDVRRSNGRLEVSLEKGEIMTPEKVLFTAGRVSNVEELGLEAVGVEVDDRGRIVVNDTFRTTAEGIYAAGDVLGPPSLASASMEQGRVAAAHAFGIPLHETAESTLPLAIYSIPEVAAAGLSEETARAQGLDCEVGRSWFGANTRANISGATEGMVKLVFDKTDRRLLGVHIVGDTASDLIHVGQAVMQHHGTIEYFVHATFAVPTQSEAYKYAAYDGLGRIGA